MSKQMFDITYGSSGDVRIEPHFCREWDEDGGCYGTNPDHGFSLDEACEEVAKYYDNLSQQYRDKSHYSLQNFLNEIINTKEQGIE